MDTYEVTHGKSSCIGDVAHGIGKVLHYLPDSQKPDQDFEETDYRGEIFEASGDEYDPYCPHTDIDNPGTKD